MSHRHIRRVVLHSLAMGLTWAAATAMLFPRLGAFDQFVMMTGLTVLCLGGAATIFAIPRAGLGYVGPLWLALIAAAVFFDRSETHITLLSAAIAGISAAAVLRANWLTFVDNVRTAAERAQFLHDSLAAKAEVEDALDRLRSMQRTVIQAEKLASLGQLVAGVAHEINTPVGIGVTGASMLAEEAGRVSGLLEAGQLKKSQLVEFVATTRDGAGVVLHNLRRAADLIQSFKTVAVEQTAAERRRFDLPDFIRDVLASLGPVLDRSRIQVSFDGPPQLEVDSYPGAVSQVLTNLCINAQMHAFEEGKGGNLRITLWESAGQVRLDVADDGRGIPARNLGQVFDPFFTTRRGSGGSGLGLHIVYNQVSGILGGGIEVESTMGQGTRFIIRFPQVAPAPLRGDIGVVPHGLKKTS
ncbi:HAMP domain-containing histidine kinase [Aerophototrophica crusticola]|uniref:histidine kinase n=1 Tax=Aerophototrophica crusticola TaxID=1709002 RepID=A0A858R5L9_9PROT|nr:HAMP domain-containing histidine kinase [Rhodospirillaceae bacterium B3]